MAVVGFFGPDVIGLRPLSLTLEDWCRRSESQATIRSDHQFCFWTRVITVHYSTYVSSVSIFWLGIGTRCTVSTVPIDHEVTWNHTYPWRSSEVTTESKRSFQQLQLQPIMTPSIFFILLIYITTINSSTSPQRFSNPYPSSTPSQLLLSSPPSTSSHLPKTLVPVSLGVMSKCPDAQSQSWFRL